MNSYKTILISYVIPIFAALFIVFGCNKKSSSNKLCKQEYALCTSASCIPDPTNPDRAICFCDVDDGPALATLSCDRLAPSTDANGIKTVYSMFSLKQLKQGKRGMKCPEGTPWTWCLNKKCTVDPSNPKKAICSCDVMRKGEWTTLGGGCNPSTCSSKYWSGAPIADFQEGIEFLVEELGQKVPQEIWCKR